MTYYQYINQKIKAAFSFFTFEVGNPATWIVGGLVFLLLLMMSFFLGFSSASLIQQDEFELTKAEAKNLQEIKEKYVEQISKWTGKREKRLRKELGVKTFLKRVF